MSTNGRGYKVAVWQSGSLVCLGGNALVAAVRFLTLWSGVIGFKALAEGADTGQTASQSSIAEARCLTGTITTLEW